MKNLIQILEENNFTLNRANEVSISYYFDTEDEAFDALKNINELSYVYVSMVIHKSNAIFFFSIDNLDVQTISDTILYIQSSIFI